MASSLHLNDLAVTPHGDPAHRPPVPCLPFLGEYIGVQIREPLAKVGSF